MFARKYGYSSYIRVWELGYPTRRVSWKRALRVLDMGAKNPGEIQKWFLEE